MKQKKEKKPTKPIRTRPRSGVRRAWSSFTDAVKKTSKPVVTKTIQGIDNLPDAPVTANPLPTTKGLKKAVTGSPSRPPRSSNVSEIDMEMPDQSELEISSPVKPPSTGSTLPSTPCRPQVKISQNAPKKEPAPATPRSSENFLQKLRKNVRRRGELNSIQTTPQAKR